MRSRWNAWFGGVAGRWTIWRYNWLAHHKMVRTLERAREHARGELLDVGCGSMPFAPIFEGFVTSYRGTDLAASRHIRDARPIAFSRAEALPFRAGSFDTLLALSMLNCLTEPVRMIEEAHRVLRPSGILLLEFEQMVPLHDEPLDYYRFTQPGAEYLLRRAGFEPLHYLPIGGLWARVGLSTIGGLNAINRGPTRVLTELPVRALYVVIQLVCELLDRLLFNPREVLSHLVIARRIP
jgi:SAM-dependent methyltransferase